MKFLSLCPNFEWKLAQNLNMNWWSKERKDTSCHIMSQKDNLLLVFQSSSFKTDSNRKLPIFELFFWQTGLWEPNPPKKSASIFAESDPVNNVESLAPELVGDQSEMVYHLCHMFSCWCGDNWEALMLRKKLRQIGLGLGLGLGLYSQRPSFWSLALRLLDIWWRQFNVDSGDLGQILTRRFTSFLSSPWPPHYFSSNDLASSFFNHL